VNTGDSSGDSSGESAWRLGLSHFRVNCFPKIEITRARLRLKRALELTQSYRPDLMQKHLLSDEDRALLGLHDSDGVDKRNGR